MAYQRWWKTVRDQQGNAVNGANCAVYNGGTGTLATVYDPNTDDSAPGGLSNPFATTANGVFGFMAADGEYDVQISGGNGATQQYRVRLSSAKTSDLEAQWQADDAVVAADAAAATALVRSDLASTATGKGAELVGTKQTGTGAVARTQAEKNKEHYSVLDFGAVGDGVADDTAAIQSAFTNVPDGCTIYFPAGTYKVTGATDITRTVSGDIVFEAGALIDATASTASNILKIAGSLGTAYVNTAAITKDTSSLTVNATLAATLTQGDLILITTDSGKGGAGTLWNTGRAYYWQGEICEVQSVSGAVVTTKNQLMDSYAGSAAVVQKISTVSCRVSGLRLKANKISTAQAGIQVQYGKNIIFHGGEVTGCSSANWAVSYVHGFVVNSCAASDNYVAALGLSYGVSVSTSQHGHIVNCNLIGGRHAVALGGFEPTRLITIENCVLDSDPASAFACADAHGNTDFINYSNNDIRNGIGASARNIRVVNNRITARSTFGFAIYADGPLGGGTYEIIGNTIFTPSANPSSSSPFFIYGDGTISYLSMINNTIETQKALSAVNFSNQPAKTITIDYFLCHNNIIKTAGGHGLYFTTVTMTSVSIEWNRITVVGAYRQIYWGVGALSSRVSLTDNTMFANTFNAQGIECVVSGASSIRCNRNFAVNTASTFYITYNLNATGYVEFCGNTLENGTSGLCAITASDILAKDNRAINVSGASTLTGRYFNEISTTTGVVKTYAAAAPAAGTWKVGDVCVQLTPAVGQPKGWRCTVAGTPGTWVSEGNL
jgi:hypothetical protein